MERITPEDAAEADGIFRKFANELGRLLPATIEREGKRRFLHELATSVSPYARRVREAILNAASGPEATAAIKIMNTAYAEFLAKGYRILVKGMAKDTGEIASSAAKAAVPFATSLALKTAMRAILVGRPGAPVLTEPELDSYAEEVMCCRIGDGTVRQMLHDVAINAQRGAMYDCKVCYARSVFGCERCDGQGLSTCTVCNGGTNNFIKCASCGGRPRSMTGGLAEDLVAQKAKLRRTEISEFGKAVVESEGMYASLYEQIKKKHKAARGEENDVDDNSWDEDAAKQTEKLIASALIPAATKYVVEQAIETPSGAPPPPLVLAPPPMPLLAAMPAPRPGPVKMVTGPYTHPGMDIMQPMDIAPTPPVSNADSKTVKIEQVVSRTEYDELLSQPIVAGILGASSVAADQAAPATANVLAAANKAFSTTPKKNPLRNFSFTGPDPNDKPDPAALDAGGVRATIARALPKLRFIGKNAANLGKGAVGAWSDAASTISATAIPIISAVSAEVAKLVSSPAFQEIIRQLAMTAAHATGEIVKETLSGVGTAGGKLVHESITGAKPMHAHTSQLASAWADTDPRELILRAGGHPLDNDDLRIVLGHIHNLHARGMKSTAIDQLENSCDIVSAAHGFASTIRRMNGVDQLRVKRLLAELITAALYHIDRRGAPVREEDKCIVMRALSCTIGVMAGASDEALTNSLLEMSYLTPELVTECVGAATTDGLMRIIRFSATAYSHLHRAGSAYARKVHTDFIGRNLDQHRALV